jgi:glycosyltransferase involved in cell wall biosynthesis
MGAGHFAKPTICCIARLVPYKRVDLLLHAFADLQANIPDIGLKIVGTGSEEHRLKAICTRLGLDGHVEFLKQLPYQNLISTLKGSSIFCLPSVVEGFGIVLAEAMAAGVPYVAAQIPACSALHRSFGGGILFKPDDAGDLATKLRCLLEDRELRRRCLEEGARSAEGLTAEAVGRQTRDLYARLVDANTAA